MRPRSSGSTMHYRLVLGAVLPIPATWCGRPRWVRPCQGRSGACRSSARQRPIGTPWWRPSTTCVAIASSPPGPTARRLMSGCKKTSYPSRRRSLSQLFRHFLLAMPIIDIDTGQNDGRLCSRKAISGVTTIIDIDIALASLGSR